MADRLAFHYYPGNSPLHRWDARCKFAALLIATFGLLQMDAIGLTFFSALFFAGVATAGVPRRSLLSDVKVWFVFLLAVFLLQAFSWNGTETPPVVSWLPATEESLRRASLTCWRLLLMLCLAVLFMFVTMPRDLQNALMWYMKPFPFLPARRIALMVSLTLRFLPLLMDYSDEVRAAGRARLADKRKNPLLRMKYFALPVFRRSLLRADELALALAARGYREDLPVRFSRVPASHAACLGALALITALNAYGIEGLLDVKLASLLEFIRRIA